MADIFGHKLAGGSFELPYKLASFGFVFASSKGLNYCHIYLYYNGLGSFLVFRKLGSFRIINSLLRPVGYAGQAFLIEFSAQGRQSLPPYSSRLNRDEYGQVFY